MLFIKVRTHLYNRTANQQLYGHYLKKIRVIQIRALAQIKLD